ncbi:hypothetical protein B0H10DRAFT_1798320 [Mycena sp. CBHHK59/15]|nr:hypothetical protein B0H10DRAFT_1798320 [Mycena sp. CBHHK59/15]
MISEEAQHRINLAIRNAWARSTLDKYTHGLQHFHDFCNAEMVPIHFRLPACEFLLCAFAASYAGSLAVFTVEGKLTTVHAWHIVNNERYNRGVRLNYVLKGIKNMAPDALPPRPPITDDMLLMLHSHLDNSNGFDATVFSAVTTAFWCQCRVGEILSKAERSFNPLLAPTVCNLSQPCSKAGSRVLQLLNTKTKRKKGENTFMGRQRGASDPVSAVESHISINGLMGADSLFSY